MNAKTMSTSTSIITSPYVFTAQHGPVLLSASSGAIVRLVGVYPNLTTHDTFQSARPLEAEQLVSGHLPTGYTDRTVRKMVLNLV